MLRLMFVTGSLPDGGAERHTMGLMEALSQRGHDCHAVCVKPMRAPVATRSGVRRAGSLEARGYLDWAAVARFTELLTRVRPHVIVAANAYALMYAALARVRARLSSRVVVVWHSTRLLNLKERLQMLVYRPLFWNADCSVFLCQRQWRYWRRRGVLSGRNEVIYNGIDLDAYRDDSSAADRAGVRARLGWSASDYVIGIPALLRVEKNHVQLLEAVRCLRELGIPARALLIGDGELRSAIEQRIADLGLDKAAVVTGLQSDVRPWIAACDVITLCSVTETFSLAALESMAMGRALVLSDVGGAAEMVVPGSNGLLFPPRDTASYVDRLAALSDPDAARRMGANARRIVEQRFAVATMVDRYEQLFEALCQSNDRAAPSAEPA
jgi:glycosyltransferase involved in cell wall biosynthesis